MEPYVYSQYVAGPGSVDFGQGAFHWMTGSASWMFRALLDWMIGVRPELDGLRFDPCLPAAWRALRLRRPWRRATLHVDIKNPEVLNKGVTALKIDGRSLEPGELLRRSSIGDEARVEVIMGAKKDVKS